MIRSWERHNDIPRLLKGLQDELRKEKNEEDKANLINANSSILNDDGRENKLAMLVRVSAVFEVLFVNTAKVMKQAKIKKIQDKPSKNLD